MGLFFQGMDQRGSSARPRAATCTREPAAELQPTQKLLLQFSGTLIRLFVCSQVPEARPSAACSSARYTRAKSPSARARALEYRRIPRWRSSSLQAWPSELFIYFFFIAKIIIISLVRHQLICPRYIVYNLLHIWHQEYSFPLFVFRWRRARARALQQVLNFLYTNNLL